MTTLGQHLINKSQFLTSSSALLWRIGFLSFGFDDIRFRSKLLASMVPNSVISSHSCWSSTSLSQLNSSFTIVKHTDILMTLSVRHSSEFLLSNIAISSIRLLLEGYLNNKALIRLDLSNSKSFILSLHKMMYNFQSLNEFISCM